MTGSKKTLVKYHRGELAGPSLTVCHDSLRERDIPGPRALRVLRAFSCRVSIATLRQKVLQFLGNVIGVGNLSIRAHQRRRQGVVLHIGIVARLEGIYEFSQLVVVINLLGDPLEKQATRLTQRVGGEYQPGCLADTLQGRHRGIGKLGIGKVVGHQHHKTSGRVSLLLQSVLDQMHQSSRHTRGGSPNRESIRNVLTVPAHSDTQAPCVGNRHGNRVDPGAALHRQVVNQIQDSVTDLLPAKIRLVPGEKKKRGPEFVLHKIQREPGWLIGRQRGLLEVKQGASCSVVDEQIVHKRPHPLGLQSVENIFVDLADSAPGVRETGQTRDKGQPSGDVRELHSFAKNLVSEHAPRIASGRGEARRLRPGRYLLHRYDGAMTLPSPSFLSSPSSLQKTDILVVGLRSTEGGPTVHAPGLPADTVSALEALAVAIDADGAHDSVWRQGPPAALEVRSVVFTGLGAGDISADRLRESAGYAALQVSTGERVVFALADSGEELEAVVEGALLGSHRVTKPGKPSDEKRPDLAILGALEDAVLGRVIISAEAVWRVRDLVTMPPNLLNPARFVDHVRELATPSSLEIEVLDEKELLAQGMGGISAVGKGSHNPPRLMIVRYRPDSPTRHVALVGKGITFDSGGLSLKAPNAMVGMKYDMTGAAVMAAATLAASALQSRTSITAYLCLAENMPSGTASRPNDVITIKNGKTVEILNTDAEGRLVMADGLSLASELNPDLIVDVATLTGAARIALGERYAGLMGTPEGVSEVEAAAKRVGEKVWGMPLPRELRSLLSSDVADIANAKPGEVLGGMLLGGLFLEEFVADGIPWAHLDIAGPAHNSQGAFGYTPKGASGAITRTVLELLLS